MERTQEKNVPFSFKWSGPAWFWYDPNTKKYCVTSDYRSTFKPKELINGKQISSKNYQLSTGTS
jgi:hypothetical protein